MIRIELIALNLIMEAWVVRFALQEAEPILHRIGIVLCGDIDVASAFCACHLGFNFYQASTPSPGFAAYIV